MNFDNRQHITAKSLLIHNTTQGGLSCPHVTGVIDKRDKYHLKEIPIFLCQKDGDFFYSVHFFL